MILLSLGNSKERLPSALSKNVLHKMGEILVQF